MTGERVGTELVAVVTAVADASPLVLTADDGQRLPSGPLRTEHRSMQAGLAAWVEQQTHHRLGYVEQLYTFADPDRSAAGGRVVSVSYLGLTQAPTDRHQPEWRDWYAYLPWEDRRPGASGPDLVEELVRPLLDAWVARSGHDDHGNHSSHGNHTSHADDQDGRDLRAAVCFGLRGRPWSPELALQRYELLHEAGLIPEALSGRTADGALVPGERMQGDHRRILATAIARLRAKIQYHPVVFELMPESFTLGQLQLTVEALAGQALHKQNFRRLVTQQDLVEPTGETDTETGGRPARLYRFRRGVLDERTIAGTKLPRTR